MNKGEPDCKQRLSMMRKQRLRIIEVVGLLMIAVAVLGWGITSPGLAAVAKPEKVKLNIGLPVPAILYLPIWVADQKGFYKEQGLTDVNILAFRGESDVIQALAAGSVDINLNSLTAVLNMIQAGQKVKVFWMGYNMTEFEWYALPKYKSISETKGGRYGVTKFRSLTDFLTRYALRNAGLDPEKDIKTLQLGASPERLAALESGQIDVTILSSPSTYVAAEKGFTKLMSQRDAIASDWPTAPIYAKEDFIARNQNTLKAFLRANGKAIEWIKANRDAAAELAGKQLKFKLEYCRKAIDDITGWHADGRLPQKGMKVFWEIAIQAGDVKETWPENKWLDNTFLKTQDQWRK